MHLWVEDVAVTLLLTLLVPQMLTVRLCHLWGRSQCTEEILQPGAIPKISPVQDRASYPTEWDLAEIKHLSLPAESGEAFQRSKIFLLDQTPYCDC